MIGESGASLLGHILVSDRSSSLDFIIFLDTLFLGGIKVKLNDKLALKR